MFFCLPNLAPKTRAQAIVLQSAVLSAIVSWILVFSACSGASGIGAKSSDPGTAAGLTISATLPQASVGSTYSGSLTASGGAAPYTFTVVSGQLPQGLSLADATGTISGTPTASGSFNFSVSVSDSTGASKEQTLAVNVANAPTAPTSPTPTSPGSGGTSLSNLQSSSGWGKYGQGPRTLLTALRRHAMESLSR